MNHDRKRPITVEDLLRLKRAERPAAEFWDRFDRELRAKQLAALVGKRPWWQSLSRAHANFARFGLPIGAAAVLVVTFVSTRQSAPTVVVSTPATVLDRGSVSERSMVMAASQAETALAVPATEDFVASAVSSPAAETPAAVEAVAASEPTAAGIFSQLASLVGDVQPAARESASSGGNLGANFASAQWDDTANNRNLLSTAQGFETRVAPARVAVDPLQQIMTPRDARREKILTAMVSIPTRAPASIRERQTKALPEDRMYDQVHRITGRGNSVSLRF